VAVLEYEQCGPSAGDAGQEIRHSSVQSVALGIRIGLDRRWEIADSDGQVGEEAGEFSARGSERCP
jgi:hypothetical protein